MKFDIFFSICQTPVDGYTPSERTMFLNFFDQVRLADKLGYGTAWVAETHLSCQTQKENPDAVIPHFQGEIGLNTDILQLAHKVFAQTKQINVGSAIRNILCNGGPLAHAEAIKSFLALHGLEDNEKRLIDIGFAAGRFPFSNIPYGITPRNRVEQLAWPVVKGLIFQEATEIFLRALNEEKFSSKNISAQSLNRAMFRSESEWDEVVRAYREDANVKGPIAAVPVASRWSFDKVGVIPFESRKDLLRLTIGSHDAATQRLANSILPCRVFNLSITPAETIEETHDAMTRCYHPTGGRWRREYLPRTTLLFLNGDRSLTPERQSAKAKEAALKAMQNYWLAMEGTLDPDKVAKAVDNAIVGNPAEVARGIKNKYHPEDRLMLWFDFNNHDNNEIKSSMEAFMQDVVPELNG
jgi:alkanesulfonate monooxygenase SsuD/methylene tetrahydromethanopterin reductase-like flavin-dependent oxidoreductase (luciferase family)